MFVIFSKKSHGIITTHCRITQPSGMKRSKSVLPASPILRPQSIVLSPLFTSTSNPFKITTLGKNEKSPIDVHSLRSWPKQTGVPFYPHDSSTLIGPSAVWCVACSHAFTKNADRSSFSLFSDSASWHVHFAETATFPSQPFADSTAWHRSMAGCAPLGIVFVFVRNAQNTSTIPRTGMSCLCVGHRPVLLLIPRLFRLPTTRYPLPRACQRASRNSPRPLDIKRHSFDEVGSVTFSCACCCCCCCFFLNIMFS